MRRVDRSSKAGKALLAAAKDSIVSVRRGQRWEACTVSASGGEANAGAVGESVGGARGEPAALAANKCSQCNLLFSSVDAFREHSKTPFHANNALRHAQGKPPLSQLDWETDSILGGDSSDSNESGDESSSSASSADDDERGGSAGGSSECGGPPQTTFFTADHMALTVWTCSLLEPAAAPCGSGGWADRQVAALRGLQAPSSRFWAVLMGSGGRFAGGVWEGGECVVHKAFARYTVRKKQGGSQVSADATGKAPKSIGASIRRKEARRYRELVGQTLGEWQVLLDKCPLIFLFAPSHNLGLFVGDGSDGLLPKSDLHTRIRRVPFPTTRPTFEECSRVYKWLSSVQMEQAQVNLPPTKETKADEGQAVGAAEEEEAKKGEKLEEEAEEQGEEAKEEGEVPVNDLLEAIQAGNLARVKSLYATGYQFEREQLKTPLLMACLTALPGKGQAVARGLLLDAVLPRDKDYVDDIDLQWLGRTALHRACHMGDEEAMLKLLHAGASPSVRGTDRQTPYNVCKTKGCRLVLRRFAGEFPNLHVYDFPPLTAEEQQQQAAKKKEAKKAARARKKAQDAEKKKEQEKKAFKEKKALEQERRVQDVRQAERARDLRLHSMSDREKRAAAVERRLKAQAGGARECDACGVVLVHVPFERLSYKYCTTVCLRKHRDELNDS